MSGNINYVVASQQAQAALLKRIADTLADHTARLTRIEATLATMDGCIDDLAQSQQRIEQALSAISAAEMRPCFRNPARRDRYCVR